MGFNVSFDLVSEINLQEHRISIHDHCPIIGIQQVNALSYGIKQFEIEAIGGKKVDHSESYGMEKGQKRTKKRLPRWQREPQSLNIRQIWFTDFYFRSVVLILLCLEVQSCRDLQKFVYYFPVK